MSTIVWIVIKATAILGLAALVQLLLRRRASAAVRHLIWTSAAASLLAFPLAVLLLPSWPVVVRTAAPAVVSAPAASVDRTPAIAVVTDAGITSDAAPVMSPPPTASAWTSRLTGISRPMILWLVYVAGVLWFSMRVLGQHLAVRRFARRASVETDREWARGSTA
jgi:beta-lactamase regulating signal transducer with metallopeptidase domain